MRLSHLTYFDRKLVLTMGSTSIVDKEVRQQLLMREVTALTETRTVWQNELLKLEAERREQEDLRRELEELQRDRAQQAQRVDDLQSKANDLQHMVSTLTQDGDR